MKYIEPIKSFILLFLVLLSITLTLMIWNYEPEYAFLEEPIVDTAMIGSEKTMQQVMLPYKLMYTEDGAMKGSTSSEVLQELMQKFATFKLSHLDIQETNVSMEKMNRLLQKNRQLTLFYTTNIPVELLSTWMQMEQGDVAGIYFDRIVIDVQSVAAKQMNVLFISTEMKTVYRATVAFTTTAPLMPIVRHMQQEAVELKQWNRGNQLSIYLPIQSMQVPQYTYYVDEISTSLFKSVLFTDPTIVQRTVENTSEKYTDGMSLLTFDTVSKTMNYVYPAAESFNEIDMTKVAMETFNFVNDHGGFTADYRIQQLNARNHFAEYQLYLKGLPVYSLSTLTRISTTWGDNRIFRYRRPYYSLDTDITTEQSIVKLPAGQEVLTYLEKQNLSFYEVNDIVLGYYLIQNQNSRLFVLEPSWFVLSGNSWTRIAPNAVGGAIDGLE